MLHSDGVRGRNLAMVAGCCLPFPRSGEIEVIPLGKAKSIGEQGAQQGRGGWAPPIRPHHQLEIPREPVVT